MRKYDEQDKKSSLDDELKQMRYVSSRLAIIAEAHASLHNYELSSDMFDMVEILDGAEKRIREIDSENINERFKQAQQSSANMLSACLAVAEKGKEG